MAGKREREAVIFGFDGLSIFFLARQVDKSSIMVEFKWRISLEL